MALLSLLSAFLMSGIAQAEILAAASPNDIRVCPATRLDASPPDFTSSECRSASFYEVDPQNTMLWIKTNIPLEKTTGSDAQPLALIISGKMSSKVFLNNVYVGQNGAPGNSKSTEIPGRMDAMLFPPQSLFRLGDNEVIFLASSHHGYVKLAHPIHAIAIGTADNFSNLVLRRYWPSLITLGLFILGVFYFGILALIRAPRRQSALFAIICAFAAGQLMSEVLRGVVSYTYPVHDLRLISITLCSAGFGLSVAYLVLTTFTRKNIMGVMLALSAAVIIAIALTRGFDGKALNAIKIPLLVSLAATSVWAYQRRARAFVYFLALLTFSGAILIFDSLFLDVVFFYLVALFLMILFIEQGVELVREMRQRRSEEARADRLQLSLDLAKEREEASEVVVKSAGKIEHIASDKIVQCRGAGGYSEIVLESGRNVLHSVSLADMEKVLPTTFLRVHRSHLINTAFVKSLNRDAAGTGTLFLTDGTEVPVSRRILPKVRQALA
jgi:hypothetical protein